MKHNSNLLTGKPLWDRYFPNDPVHYYQDSPYPYNGFLYSLREYAIRYGATPRQADNLIRYAEQSIIDHVVKVVGKLGPRQLVRLGTMIPPAVDDGVVVRLLIDIDRDDDDPVVWESATFSVPEDGQPEPRPGQP